MTLKKKYGNPVHSVTLLEVTDVFHACMVIHIYAEKVKDNEDYTLDYKPPRQHMMINTITYKNTLPYTTIIGLTEMQIIYVNYQYTKILYYVFVY